MTGCLTLICLLLVEAPISYFSGWITGIITEFLMGDIIVNGMNYLFNTTRFTTDMIPTIFGTLSVLGSFFKDGTSYKEK